MSDSDQFKWHAVFEGRYNPQTGENLGSNFCGIRVVTSFRSYEEFEAALEHNEDEVVYSGSSSTIAHAIADRDEIEAHVDYALWLGEQEPHQRQHHLSNQIVVAAYRNQVEMFLAALQEKWDPAWGDFADIESHLRFMARIFSR